MQFSAIFTVLAAAILQQVALAAPAASPVDKDLPSPTRPDVVKRDEHFGDATYYFQNGAFGSCGQVHSDNDYIIAMSSYWNGNKQVCGRKVVATNRASLAKVTVTVADLCPSCAQDSIDFAIGPMKALDPNYVQDGRIAIEWHMCSTTGQC